ncbi:MAG: hypothetical protein ABSE73_12400, partial [Planctomycetota bacterium]
MRSNSLHDGSACVERALRRDVFLGLGEDGVLGGLAVLVPEQLADRSHGAVSAARQQVNEDLQGFAELGVGVLQILVEKRFGDAAVGVQAGDEHAPLRGFGARLDRGHVQAGLHAGQLADKFPGFARMPGALGHDPGKAAQPGNGLLAGVGHRRGTDAEVQVRFVG